MKFWKNKKNSKILNNNFLEPDEIFLDSSNLPNFDENMLEGKLEKTISKKTTWWLIITIILISMIITGRTFILSVKDNQIYKKWSTNNRLQKTAIFAKRGVIYDRNNLILAQNKSSDKPYDLRKYTELNGLGHILGFVKYPAKDKNGFYYNTEITGLDGVEKIFNSELKGQTGAKIIETDVMGKIISESILQKPKDGKPIKLSIDAEITDKLYSLIEKTALERKFTGGSGVLMKLETGEVLALTNYPEYKPQILSDGKPQSIITQYAQNKSNPYLNRAVDGVYTPGSIVKPFIALGVLNEKIIDPKKIIVSTGSISIPNEYDPEKVSVFNDWKAHGPIDMEKALAVSSDVYFYEVGGGFKDQPGLGILKIEKYLQLFGFGSAIDDPFLKGQKGTIPNPDWKAKHFNGDPWRIGDTYNTSIGQYGMQTTPIQAVRAVSAIALNGKMVEPSILYQDGKIPIKKISTGLKEKDLRVVQRGMRLAVTEGSATGLNIPQIKIAAKTGTAEIGLVKDFVNSWVIGFFPYEKPKYAFAFLMEKGPADNKIGALYVMRQLIEWIIANKKDIL